MKAAVDVRRAQGCAKQKKQSAKGLTSLKCGEVGNIQRHCHKGRSQGFAQSADGDSVGGGRQGERGRGNGRGRGSRGRRGRSGNQAAAGGDAPAVASSAATLGCGSLFVRFILLCLISC